ncbi:MAG: 3-phosphoshikimate 1-carboxyvinyltransferase [Eubacterium sp.]
MDYQCKPLEKGRSYEVTVPGSKSITNRALLLGALAEGKTVVRGVLFSDDSRVFMKALEEIGFSVLIDEESKQVEIEGLGGRVPTGVERRIYVGSAGTAARFLTAMLSLSGERFLVESSEQMKARPMEPLLRALEMLGVTFEYLEKPYAFPFRICGREENAVKEVDLNIDASSQFLSALLLSAVMCKEGLQIHLTGTRDARSYVNISMKMMEEFGVKVQQTGENSYLVNPGQIYRRFDGSYQVEPDVSAACYFYGIAALTESRVKVMHVHSDSTQGDIRFLDVLDKMGCNIEEENDGIVVVGPKDRLLHGIHVKMTDFSDQTMTLAAIAPFAEGKTVIDGVGHIRKQESDRIRGIVTELTKLGIRCEEREDGMTIYSGQITPGSVDTYDDHRMAMAFSLIGQVVEDIVIKDAECCKKTFEDYFDVLTNLDLASKIEE